MTVVDCCPLSGNGHTQQKQGYNCHCKRQTFITSACVRNELHFGRAVAVNRGLMYSAYETR